MTLTLSEINEMLSCIDAAVTRYGMELTITEAALILKIFKHWPELHFASLKAACEKVLQT